MKSNQNAMKSIRTWTAAAVVALANLQQAAQACPGCKQPEGQPLSGASLGFGWSIGFMLLMVAGTLGGIGWMMYRSCQALAARDMALAAGGEAA